MTKRVWCRAEFSETRPDGTVRIVKEFGGGATYALAEIYCKNWIKRDPNRKHKNRPLEQWTFHRHTMAKPKFKVGERVYRIELGPRKVYKVLELPTTPSNEGYICYEIVKLPVFGGAAVWAGEKEFASVA